MNLMNCLENNRFAIIKLAKEAGANIFVAGNYIFGSKNPMSAYADLKRAML